MCATYFTHIVRKIAGAEPWGTHNQVQDAVLVEIHCFQSVAKPAVLKITSASDAPRGRSQYPPPPPEKKGINLT